MRIKPNLENLVRVRKAKGITQSEMAEKLGITLQAYWKKENGESPLKLEEAKIIAKTLDMSIDKLFYSVVCVVI